MKYKFISEEAARLYDGKLKRATDGSAGFDLRLYGFDDNGMVNTGVKMAIPDGYVGLLFIRSSLAKKGFSLSNAVGVIDSDYRGEIKAKLNFPTEESSILQGDRFAQIVIVQYHAQAEIVEDLDDTERGSGGFGSTGV